MSTGGGRVGLSTLLSHVYWRRKSWALHPPLPRGTAAMSTGGGRVGLSTLLCQGERSHVYRRRKSWALHPPQPCLLEEEELGSPPSSAMSTGGGRVGLSTLLSHVYWRRKSWALHPPLPRERQPCLLEEEELASPPSSAMSTGGGRVGLSTLLCKGKGSHVYWRRKSWALHPPQPCLLEEEELGSPPSAAMSTGGGRVGAGVRELDEVSMVLQVATLHF
ncbi:PREDICTED: uncharacterized protein LOC108803348 [Nanorana parkeri]|uniref:uncharacterized protein LOC108803348 n=1 Tax=Nanorana parkeri TaxID=125878 RepID=UPI0008541779|nr:PREDICTED: uncharacterized protein LOC108803348 [Nanorana parkeri]